MLCLLAAGAALAALAAPTQAAAVGLADRRIEVQWLITWGGLPIFEAQMQAEIAGGRYTAEFEGRSRGIIEVAAKNRTTWRTVGRVTGNVMAPDRMEQRYLMRTGSFREITMTWAESGAIATRIEPPEPKSKRKPVPEDMQRGAIDPLTAILNGLVAPRDGPPCKYEAKLFEGRRRIDIRMSFHRSGNALAVEGHEDLPDKATVCLLRAERLAGFRDRHLKEVPKLYPLKLWIVRLEEAGIWLPVEMALKTRYGIARARLTKLDIR